MRRLFTRTATCGRGRWPGSDPAHDPTSRLCLLSCLQELPGKGACRSWVLVTGCITIAIIQSQGSQVAPTDASRKRTLPGWQRWMLAPTDASRKRTLPGWQQWMPAPTDASRKRTLPSWQRWMLAPSDASGTRTLPGWQPPSIGCF